MPKLLEDFFQNNKPQIILTEKQRKRFLNEILSHENWIPSAMPKKRLVKMVCMSPYLICPLLTI